MGRKKWKNSISWFLTLFKINLNIIENSMILNSVHHLSHFHLLLEQRLTMWPKLCRIAARTCRWMVLLRGIERGTILIPLSYLGSGNLQSGLHPNITPHQTEKEDWSPRTDRIAAHQKCGSNSMCRYETSPICSLVWLLLPRLIFLIPKISTP